MSGQSFAYENFEMGITQKRVLIQGQLLWNAYDQGQKKSYAQLHNIVINIWKFPWIWFETEGGVAHTRW